MHIKDYKLDNMCSVLEINKRTYYKYRNAEDKDYYDYLLIKEIFDESYLNLLLKKSQGNALRFEQEIALLFDVGYISAQDSEIIINEEKKPNIQIETFEKLIPKLSYLEQEKLFSFGEGIAFIKAYQERQERIQNIIVEYNNVRLGGTPNERR